MPEAAHVACWGSQGEVRRDVRGADGPRREAPAKPVGLSFADKIGYIGLLTANPMPVSRFGSRRAGTDFTGTSWLELFRNPLARPVAVQIEAALWTTPGGRLRLSRESSGGDASQADELVNGGPLLSLPIIVDAGRALYGMNNTPGGVAFVAGDVFRVRIWDPWDHLSRSF